jgi:DNA modification methylase
VSQLSGKTRPEDGTDTIQWTGAGQGVHEPMSDEIDDWTQDIHVGDVRERLSELPANSVHMGMTSPPYYNLRDYGEDDQIGLEDSLDGYISELVSVFEDIHRVLRPDGSFWLNLGDSYQDKQKMLVPHRVAIALQDAGWVVRNDVTWVKPNPMPQSVTDRLNTTTEQVFHLTPETNYWYDLDAVKEPYETSHDSEPPIGGIKHQQNQNRAYSGNTPDRTDGGKNPGDVFEVSARPFPEAHFAVFPPELVQKPIKATCPPKVCVECGTPYDRKSETVTIWEQPRDQIERTQARRALELADKAGLETKHFEAARAVGIGNLDPSEGNPYERVDAETATLAKETKSVLGSYYREALFSESQPDGWTQNCDCDTDATESGIALDPFAGAGTTCLVAKDLGRRFVGVELNPEYVAMAQERLSLTVDDPEQIRDADATGLEQFTADEVSADD